MLVDDIDVRKQALDNRLQARILYFEDSSVFKERQGTACLKDLFNDVNDSFHRYVLLGKSLYIFFHIVVTINDTINDAMRLDEEVYV